MTHIVSSEDLLTYINEMTLEGLAIGFDVSVKEYKGYTMLNYSQLNSASRGNHFIGAMRGLVVTEDLKQVVCRPFTRFYNNGEMMFEGSEVWCFNQMLSGVFEIGYKHDGSLISMWWSDMYEKWMMSTKGALFAEGNIRHPELQMMGIDTFSGAINTFIDVDSIVEEYCVDKNQTYLFEWTSKYNHIVTNYRHRGSLEPLASVSNITGRITEYYASERSYGDSFTALSDVFSHIDNRKEEFSTDMEGFVVYDSTTQMMVKFKYESYVRLHHLRDKLVTVRTVLGIYLDNEVAEMLTYFPEYESLIDLIQVYFNEMNKQGVEYTNNCRRVICTDSGLRELGVDKAVHSMIMKMLMNVDYQTHFHEFYKLKPKRAEEIFLSWVKKNKHEILAPVVEK